MTSTKLPPRTSPKNIEGLERKLELMTQKLFHQRFSILGQKYHEINVSRPQFWYGMVSGKSLVSIPSSFLIYSIFLVSMMNYLWKLRDLRRIYGYCNTLAIY